MSTLSLSPDHLRATPAAKDALPLWRLYLMRGVYALIGLGMGSMIWPDIINHPLSMHGVGPSMLGALTLLCLLGIRYPVQMLPMLFFETAWKIIWLCSVAYPAWQAGQMDSAVWQSTQEVLWVVIMPFVIPWRYVFVHYVKGQGERWR
jgi:hypothetical protein